MMKGPALLCVLELKSRCKVKFSIRRRKAGKSQNVKKKVLVKIRQARVISVKGAPFMRMHPSLVFVNMVGRENHDGCYPHIRALVGCYKQCRVSMPPQAVGRPASGGRSLHSVVQTVLVAGNIVSNVVEGDAIRGHDGVVAQREQR
jgi:hypothetical protein